MLIVRHVNSTREFFTEYHSRAHALSGRYTAISTTRSQQSSFSMHSAIYFRSAAPLCKKGGKSKGGAKSEETSSKSSSSSAADAEDPYDFSTLEVGIEKTVEKLKGDLSKLRTGGRFNPESLENVRVSLSKESKETIKLGDLAQVIPKGGRNIILLVGDKEVSKHG
jgi:ribosome recycling factor